MQKHIAPKLATGYGQYHTNNPTAKNSKPLNEITIDEIFAMAENPPSIPKADAQWFIPSTQLSRLKEDQLKLGAYHALWLDLDEGLLPSATELSILIASKLDCDHLVYSSRSATEANRKCRIVIPTETLDPKQYWKVTTALNVWASEQGLTPDVCNQNGVQLCYLPNKGKFYETQQFNKGLKLKLSSLSDQLKTVDKALEDHRAAEREALITSEARKIIKLKNHSDKESPIEAFNRQNDVKDILTRNGYRITKDTFLRPGSKSKTSGKIHQGTRVYSHSTEDPLHDEHGKDAFNCFCTLEHNGNVKEAIKAVI